MTVKKEESGSNKIKSVILFESSPPNKTTSRPSKKPPITYRPPVPPYGLVSQKRLVFGKKTFFLTGWAKGARSILFRVFHPEKNKHKPLCEFISFSETSSLKLKKGLLKIKTQEDSASKGPKWRLCYDFS